MKIKHIEYTEVELSSSLKVYISQEEITISNGWKDLQISLNDLQEIINILNGKAVEKETSNEECLNSFIDGTKSNTGLSPK